MRFCTHPSHADGSMPWIMDGEPDHEHPKPRCRYVDGEWKLVEEKERE